MNQLLLVILLVVNFISLVLFGVDKLGAKRSGARIPESRLLLAAFLGPFGAYIGMLFFRHKTRKPRFLLAPLFLLGQLVLIYYFHLI